MLEEQVQTLRLSSGINAYNFSEVKSTHKKDKTVSIVSLIIEQEKRLQERRLKLIKTLNAINSICNCDLLTNKQRMILVYRYFNMYKWEDIAEKMNYSTRNIYVEHRKALAQLSNNEKLNTILSGLTEARQLINEATITGSTGGPRTIT